MSDAAPTFSNVLARLGSALDDRSVEGRPLSVIFDPARRAPSAAGEVLVGLGAWTDAGGQTVPHAGACLNNKGAAQAFGLKREPATVATFIREAPDSLVEAWRSVFGTDPVAALDAATLVVEDASPDSVLSLVFWLARLAGVAPADLPQRWITTLTTWERDGVAASVTRSWTALLSALSHSHFGSRLDGEGIAAAWSDALRFTVALLANGVDPDAVDAEHAPSILADPGYGRAIAFAMNERQDYLQSLSRAVRLELLVPMAGAPGRQLLVDAYFATETSAPSGMKKVFIRTDTEHTSLGNGFSLMGLYRPGLEGSGNDMTLSVDPRSGIYLKDLWQRLEAAENEHWEGRRPSSAPRRISSYPTGGFDQPWWDDHGRYTLLGAPKRVSEDELGSKLSWDDVLETIWRSYNQLRDIEVLDLGETGLVQPRRIEECKATPIRSGEGAAEVTKQLIVAKWVRDATHPQHLQFTDTVKRHLAGMIQNAAEGRTGPVRLADLPDAGDFDVIQLSGGMAVISREGLFLIDDWRNRDLGIQTLTADFATTVALLAQCNSFDAEVDELYVGSSGKSRLFGSKTAKILQRITMLRAAVAAAFQDADLTEASPDRRNLRSALEARWGLEGKEEALVGRLKDLQEILETKSTLDTAGMATILGIVAVPNFATDVAGTFAIVVESQTSNDGVFNALGFTIWMALVLAGNVALFLLIVYLLSRRRT